MPTVLSNPKTTAIITATLSGGAAPAPSSAAISQALFFNPAVGTTAGQVNLAYSAAFTVTSGTPLVLDMTNLTDPLDGAINFAHVLAIIVENDSTTSGQDFTIGGASSHPLNGDLYTAQANGGAVLIFNPNPGWAVTGGTAQNLQIAVAAGTSVAGKITILGRST